MEIETPYARVQLSFDGPSQDKHAWAKILK